MTLTLDRETTEDLTEAARQHGAENVNDFAVRLLQNAVHETLYEPYDAPISEAERQQLEDALELGLADVAAGRTKPMHQVLAEVREKFGFSEDFPFGNRK